MMKVLYGIQGTGHGHISRARDIIPQLAQIYDLDVLISGYNNKLKIDYPIRYKLNGISFVYGHGGISITQSLRRLRIGQFLKDVKELPVRDYDLIISDFEPITAWAARLRGVHSLNLSHQASFISDKIPRPPKISSFAEGVIRNFAPCDEAIGFHFQNYDAFILPPIIRKEIRDLDPYKAKHITVYLPAWSVNDLVEVFEKLDFVEWQVFTPYVETQERNGNITLLPISNEKFLKSVEGCIGLVTSSGFESCAEAMFLGKKLFTVPIRNQYEQYCNAAALRGMGVSVRFPDEIDSLEDDLEMWLHSDEKVALPTYATAKDVVQQLQPA